MWKILFCFLFASYLVTCQQYRLSSLTPENNGFSGNIVLDSNMPNPTASPVPNTPWMENLNLKVTYRSESILHVKITDATTTRWEVPDIVTKPDPSTTPNNLQLSVSFTHSPFGFAVTRKVDGVVVFNSTPPGGDVSFFNGLVFQDQYLELSTSMITNPNIYGLGERIQPFRLNPSSTYTIFNRDVANAEYTNMYGAHPFYMQVLADGTANGVFLLNSNPMDVVMNGHKTHNFMQSLTYKTIGGVLDLYIFVGPSPSEVTSQYWDVIGNPALQAYWTLGPHQCRYGYHDLQVVKDVVGNYSKYNLPLETIWNDIDWMNKYYDFQFDPVRYPVAEYAAFINDLHTTGMRNVLILDPGIPDIPGQNYRPYDLSVSMDINWKKDDNKTDYVGYLWPGNVVFPQFHSPGGQSYWSTLIQEFRAGYNGVPGIKVDGLWTDMNEPTEATLMEKNTIKPHPAKQQKPLNLVKRRVQLKAGSNYDNPPYSPGNEDLSARTIPMSSPGLGGIDGTKNVGLNYIYNLHNMYGFHESVATYQGLLASSPGMRPFSLSRSSFAGSGRYVAVWGGDNNSNFNSLTMSIAQIMSLNLFGITMSGPDVCGFNGESFEELCLRWYQFAVVGYPFFRNHNTISSRPQEPYTFSTQMTNSVRDLLHTRMSMLPYWYRQNYAAHTEGVPIMRPVWWNFPSGGVDVLYYDHQTMIGPSLLVNPVLSQGDTSVYSYFPQHGKSANLPVTFWYNLWTGKLQDDGSNAGGKGTFGTYAGTWKSIDSPLYDTTNAQIAGGSIIPLQITMGANYQPSCPSFAPFAKLGNSPNAPSKPALNTRDARTYPWALIVALGSDGAAQGELVIDDGQSIDSVTSGSFTLLSYSVKPTNSTAYSLTTRAIHTGYTEGPYTVPVGSIKVYGGHRVCYVTIDNQPVPFVYDSTFNTFTVQTTSFGPIDRVSLNWNTCSN